MNNKLITITGGDLTGKETQTRILLELLGRHNIHAERMEFPRYDQPWGKLMGAMLDEEWFKLGSCIGYSRTKTLRGGDWAGVISKKGNEKVFQALCQADKLCAQKDIKDALERGWLICDRYDADLLVYGMQDASYDHGWVMSAYETIDHKSDIVIVLINRSGQYSRPGETKDVNERDLEYQNRVYDCYETLAPKYGWHIIRVDELADPEGSLLHSVWNVTDAIVKAINTHGYEFVFKESDWRLCKKVLDAKEAQAA